MQSGRSTCTAFQSVSHKTRRDSGGERIRENCFICEECRIGRCSRLKSHQPVCMMARQRPSSPIIPLGLVTGHHGMIQSQAQRDDPVAGTTG